MSGRSIFAGTRALIARRPRLASILALLTTLAAATIVYSVHVGAPPVVYRDGLFYFSVRPDSSMLPRPVRLALLDEVPEVHAGEATWRELQEGLEIGEIPVLAGNEEVDRLYLTRIDPARYTFRQHVNADNDLDDWLAELQPVAVINGSYYSPDFGPATPVIIDGTPAGPSQYDATHAAFVSGPQGAAIFDLSASDWRALGGAAETMFVSYPTLLDHEGANRAPESDWLASRSFIGEDTDGNIILGSAPEGFFSLYRLGEFLRQTPVEWRYVLNLDGGPVACHAVAAGGEQRKVYGKVEIQSDAPGAPLRVLPSSQYIPSAMPIVIAVYPRTGPTGPD